MNQEQAVFCQSFFTCVQLRMRELLEAQNTIAPNWECAFGETGSSRRRIQHTGFERPQALQEIRHGKDPLL